MVTVTANDNTAPVPDMPSLPALTGECSVAMATAPNATDNCDTGTITGTTDAFPVTSTSTITWTFTDGAGNVTTQTQQVTITADVTRPVPVEASLSALTGECSVTLAMAMAAAPTATDNCDVGTITGTTDAASFPITANSMITWTFTDMTGNTTTQDQQVVVDMTRPAPVEASLSALTGECSVTLAMAMAVAPTATDNCDVGTITGTTDAASFPITANSMVTWTFTDMTGNTTTQTQQVTITPDMTGPTPVEASLSALTGECSVTLVMAMAAAPTATDNCDVGTITGTTDAASFPITTNSMITWTFTDATGNTTTQTQQVTITPDMTGPAPVEASLSALTGQCSVTLAMAMAAAPTATDNCDVGTITGTTDAASFPITANSMITWTFTDEAGNVTTQEQQVTLNCTPPPLGVEEEPGISMYPNPSEGSLAFSTGNYGSLSIKIYRIDGALVFAGITRDTTPINIETLAAGSYVVQATANGTTVFTSRLLKRD